MSQPTYGDPPRVTVEWTPEGFLAQAEHGFGVALAACYAPTAEAAFASLAGLLLEQLMKERGIESP